MIALRACWVWWVVVGVGGARFGFCCACGVVLFGCISYTDWRVVLFNVVNVSGVVVL